MASNEKNFKVKLGVTTPKVDYTLNDNVITAEMLDLAIPTLSYSGSAGQLFSISDDLTGTIFSVNDISGIPSIEVNADGTVSLAGFNGKVGIGTITPLAKLDVNGAIRTNDGIYSSTDLILGSNDTAVAYVKTSGEVGIGVDTPTNTLDVNGTFRARTVNNATGDFATVSATGILQKRTAAEVLSDIGASGSSHNHTLDSLSNTTITANSNGEILRWNGTAWINNTLAEANISAIGHTHTTSNITDLSSYTGFDARYYTESEITTLLSGKSDTSHNHTLDSLSNVTVTSNSAGEILKWSGSAWINNTLAEAGIAPTSHTHTKSQITDFAHTHPAGDITGLATVATTGAYSDLSGIPSTFTPASHTHGNISNTGAIGTTSNLVVTTTTSGVLTTSSRSGIDSRSTFPPSSHTHPVTDISDSTTVGQNIVKVTNPSAIRFLRVNADNTVSLLTNTDFRTAIGAGTSSTVGTVTSVGGTGTVSGITLSGTVTSSGNLTLGGTLSTPISTINDSTTVGQNLVKLINPSAIRFLRINADNTVSALTNTDFRTAIGAGTSSTTGTVTSVAAGNGLSFTTITGSGSVTLGTPGTVTGATTNSVTATSHTHAVTLTASDVGAADTSHAHGNITSAGAIGTTADLVVTTTTSGVLTTSSRSGIDTRTTFPPSSHTHDDRYYTETETDTLLDGKAELVHTHTKSEITDFEHEHPAEQVQMNTDFDLRDWYDSIQSAGRLSGGKITNNGDGTVSVAFGRGLIKSVSSTAADGEECELGVCGQISETQYVTWNTVPSVALTDEAYNYIYYDGSTGNISATTDFYSIDFTRDFSVGRAYRSGTNVVARLCGTNIWNFNRRVQLFGEEYLGVVRARGLNVGPTGTRNISVSEGILWAEGVNRFLVDDFDSSGADRFTYWYRNGVGGWTQQINQSQINNTQYDNGSGTLQTLNPNRVGVHWVYVVHDSSIHVVFGQGNYTAAEAEAATPPPTIPGLLEAYATLVAKIRVVRDSDTLSIDSAFTQLFQTSGVTDHNELANIGTYLHTQIDSHIDDATLHRVINDAATTTTNLWSASKISTELAGKANTSHTHTKSQITDFAHTHTTTDVTNLSSYTGFDARYYTETEVDAFAVKLTGNQTIAGVKTFSSTIAGSISGSAATLTTPRSITIGAAGAFFDGSAGINLSLLDIGAASLDFANTFAGENTFNGTVNFRSNVDLADTDILSFGNSDDLQIHHTGGTNYIDIYTGDLVFRNDNVDVAVTISPGNGKLTATSLESTFATVSSLTITNSSTWDNNSPNYFRDTGGTGRLGMYMSSGNTLTVGGPDNPTSIRSSVTPTYHGPSGTYDIYHEGNLKQVGVFWENDTTVATSYTITAGKNAMSAGPITINTGITVTVPTGSVWTIV